MSKVLKAVASDWQALIDPSDTLAKPRAIGFDRTIIGFGRGQIAIPKLCTVGDRLIDLPKEEFLNSGDHLLGEVALHGERFGVWQRSRFRRTRKVNSKKQRAYNQQARAHESDD